jgi:hypothetical protein
MAGNAEFDDAWMVRFREIVEIKDEAALAALRTQLIEIGQRYRRIIESTPCDLKGAPFNKSLTQRIDWLQVNAVRPAERLLAALADDQRGWYATWPYEHEFDEFPDRESLRAELQKVHAFSSRLMAVLQGERGADAGTNQELRFYIFSEIAAAVRKHLPAFNPKQGVYHAEYDTRIKRFVGPYAEAIRHIYQEITGLDEQLVRLIRMMVKDPDWQL